MIPVVGILGFSDSGKTMLVEGLSRELTRRGLRVGTLKHDGHGHTYDRIGSDTWRHRQGGAEASLVFSSGELALFGGGGGLEKAIRLLSAWAPSLELILLEGFQQGGYPSIVLTAGDYPPPPGKVLAIRKPIAGEGAIDAAELAQLVDLVEAERQRQIAQGHEEG